MSNVKILVGDQVVADSIQERNAEALAVHSVNLVEVNARLSALPAEDRFAVATLAWIVAMSTTCLDQLTNEQRAAITAYWKACETNTSPDVA